MGQLVAQNISDILSARQMGERPRQGVAGDPLLWNQEHRAILLQHVAQENDRRRRLKAELLEKARRQNKLEDQMMRSKPEFQPSLMDFFIRSLFGN